MPFRKNFILAFCYKMPKLLPQNFRDCQTRAFTDQEADLCRLFSKAVEHLVFDLAEACRITASPRSRAHPPHALPFIDLAPVPSFSRHHLFLHFALLRQRGLILIRSLHALEFSRCAQRFHSPPRAPVLSSAREHSARQNCDARGCTQPVRACG